MPPEAEVSYPTATQQDQHHARDGYHLCPARRRGGYGRQRVGTGAAPRLQPAYVGKLEAEGVIRRQGDGLLLDQSRVAHLRYLRREATVTAHASRS